MSTDDQNQTKDFLNRVTKQTDCLDTSLKFARYCFDSLEQELLLLQAENKRLNNLVEELLAVDTVRCEECEQQVESLRCENCAYHNANTGAKKAYEVAIKILWKIKTSKEAPQWAKCDWDKAIVDARIELEKLRKF